MNKVYSDSATESNDTERHQNIFFCTTLNHLAAFYNIQKSLYSIPEHKQAQE
jgi:hypothetical protein